MKIKILLIIFGVFLLCGISFAEIPGSIGPDQMPESSTGDTETYRPFLGYDEGYEGGYQILGTIVFDGKDYYILKPTGEFERINFDNKEVEE